MTDLSIRRPAELDRTNAVLAAFVYVISFVVYAMTVQPTLSFWDCGEFIACARILGVPHPPGTPLFILLGRLFSLIPFVDDISYRINYISVITSALTGMFSYLLTVRLVSYFFAEKASQPLNRYIAYIGGLAGSLFVAFSRTNWGNSVEAEVYGLALAFTVMIVWLTLRFYEDRGSIASAKTLILIFYVALLGVGLHMTVFLVVPICAIFFVLNRSASAMDWLLVSAFFIVELLLIMLFSNGRGGATVFYTVSLLLVAALLVKLYNKINWMIFVATASVATVMIAFQVYMLATLAVLFLLTPFAMLCRSISTRMKIVVLVAIGLPAAALWFFLTGSGVSEVEVLVAAAAAGGLGTLISTYSAKYNHAFNWKGSIAIVMIGLIGMSVHLFIPIRSLHNPRIDENNPSRGFDSLVPWEWDTSTFISFLDRKQYGQVSMTDRMFNRRGSWSNQLGRHPHMGFWSYFEEQFSPGGWLFLFPFFSLGVIGLLVAIRKRIEVGMPFLALFLLASIGLVLYMNFADGTKYSFVTGDAYLEVRNRDYFFTPAFVFFGVAMGMGLSAVILFLKNKLATDDISKQKMIVYGASVLVLLPVVSLAHNYHVNDRSDNYIPYYYATNLLDTCAPNSLLFTSGDNDTFPLWCVQEVYNYRKDVRVVNLSLLNTDWYIEQMKNRYDVPISLSNDQILWYPVDDINAPMGRRPLRQYYNRLRKQQLYLQPTRFGNSILKVQDVMVDEIVLESITNVDGDRWEYKQPIYFSSQPYAASPLKLRERAVAEGLLYRLAEEPVPRLIDAEKGFDLFQNTYTFSGYKDSHVYRDENATGVYISVGINALRLFDELVRTEQPEKAKTIAQKMIDVYPEYWQTYLLLGDQYTKEGDTARADELYVMWHDTLAAFYESNPENLFYMQDLAMAKFELGKRTDDSLLTEQGIQLLWDAFMANPNSNYAFRKLVTVLSQRGRFEEIQTAARQFADYKINQGDPFVQQILGITKPGGLRRDPFN